MCFPNSDTTLCACICFDGNCSPLDFSLCTLQFVEFLQFWGNALYDVQDLPFTIENLPLVFTHFRKQIEQAQLLCEPLPVPEIIKPFPEYDKSWYAL